MKALKPRGLLVLLALLPACGQRLVQFDRDASAPDSSVAGDGALAGDGKVGDGGPSDGSTIDGNMIDAASAIDGSTIDAASPIDGSVIDASAIDASIADASIADASIADASVRDGSTACNQLPVVLGAAGNFVVLAGSTVTNTGPTTVTGDLGVSPGSAVTGFPPGIVVGTQHVTDTTAASAAFDLTAAYNDAAGRTLCPISISGNLGGQTLPPGLYKSTGSLAISSGDLTLDGQGDSNAVFIFQMASTLNTTPGRQVVLIGNAKASNVFWQVGTSATLGTTTVLQGTVMADQGIMLDTGATVNGRLLARIGAVTLDSSTIIKPAP